MEPLKNIYNDYFFKEFSTAVKKVYPTLDTKKFLSDCRGAAWPAMELKQRMRHLATTLHEHLTGTYQERLEKMLAIMEAVPRLGAEQYGSLAYMLFPDFVEQYGLEEPDLSLAAMEKISFVTSCEFAIRPYLIRYPKKVMAQMLRWSKHPSDKLRRFASEGCRPRLPWAMAIPDLKKSPEPILPILENLKNDASLFVRKSVANNLNDISKDHPEQVIQIAKKWQGKSANTDWIIKHGCRGLLKNGNIEALSIFGTASGVDCEISLLKLSPARILLGEKLNFSFQLKLREASPKKLRLEYRIVFARPNGKTGQKIFKIAESIYPNYKPIQFSRTLSFKDLTTRKHYTGKHSIAIIVNGLECCRKSFQLYD